MAKKIFDFEEHREVFEGPSHNPTWDRKGTVSAGRTYFKQSMEKGPRYNSIICETVTRVLKTRVTCDVIEHGGRLGEEYIGCKKSLPDSKLTWKIVEIPQIVKVGREEFTPDYPDLTFHLSVYDLKEPAHIVCSSCSFIYVESDWEAFIKRKGELAKLFVIFYHTPCTTTGHTYYFMHGGNPYNVLSVEDASDILDKDLS